MLNKIKVSMMFLASTFLVFLPKASYAWDNQHGHEAHHAYHGHSFYAHANPDLTLVSGMDDIDTRVLVAADPDQPSAETDEVVPNVEATTPPQAISSDAGGNFIVNVPNNAGGYTPVHIQKWGNAYLGPQGELYYPFPDISQLKTIYGI